MAHDLFRHTVRLFGRRLAAVGPDKLGAPTPCNEWDVRALVNHVAGELRWVPPLLEGKTVADVGDRLDGDLLGDDPVGEYRAAMEEALGAAERPGTLAQTVHLSFGDVQGAEYLSQITADVTIHTWDLARGAGLDERLDREQVETVLAFLAPQAEQWREAGAFGPVVEVGDDADAQTRLLAITGRQASA